MSTETHPQHDHPNDSNGQNIILPKFVQRVVSIPLVADTIGALHSTIHSNAYSAAMYEKAEDAILFLFEQTKPLQIKLAGPIEQVDVVANKGLDFVQAKAPLVFEIKTEDLISRARQPADQAYAYGKTCKDAASARLAPIVEQFYAQFIGTHHTLSNLQESLQGGLQNIRTDPKAVPDQIKHLCEQLIGELEGLSGFVLEKRKDLPQHAQNVIEPLFEKLHQGYGDIKGEMAKTELNLTQRATNVLQYSRDHALPLVHELLLDCNVCAQIVLPFGSLDFCVTPEAEGLVDLCAGACLEKPKLHLVI
ncbi:hypothetical protein O181_044726 [Austropuccinia psidii MF-1]|uniref:Uncharacterized protein n=1 Tax=Austropuccinia psidii MF-1 TaxID=1389203 RepID=A0A9Q3DQZ0_9BASI|nr:hypothetical protein [Austropuccinia psidii MF-1]